MTDIHDTQTFYPRLPSRADPRWEQVLIRVENGSTIALYNLPRSRASIEVAVLNNNDLLYIVPDVTSREWVAARSGHKVGWLNTTLAHFTFIRSSEAEPIDNTEAITEVATPINKKDVHRLINYLKGVTRAFSK